ncbi:hypothetical protein Dsin_012994 [Dipteronia sinensis]|uniref:Uncharacterized protein n=1 Tax=Dipteronia sinensis TaxID=43782 RepID=A0AAE0E8P5_9ROSI|nr:hypothetical protein Dsin_012994 [Dipteronia sinensis]
MEMLVPSQNGVLLVTDYTASFTQTSGPVGHEDCIEVFVLYADDDSTSGEE